VPVCAQCGQKNSEGARFCNACGAALVEAPPAGEVRKTVTVVFTDVTGSTSLGERLDPESLRRVMSRYFDAMSAVLERHGGTVEKYIGDAVMAVFGVPVLHEDDALRAVRAAAEMRERLTELNAAFERDFGVRIHARTGVNTGEVVTGEAAGQRLATGDAVNVAARLEQMAQPGEILIGEATRRLARDAVEVDPAELLELKGKGEPVAAFRLRGVREGAPAYTRRLDSPMVGRERELALLRQAFDRAVDERACHLFTILGPAGVGKSRLVLELLASVGGEARVLSGRCLPYGEGITFWPLVEIFQQADAEHELDAAFAAASAEETFWAVRKLFEALADERPLVLILDDVHWAEETFLDLIEHLADWSRDAPILLACLARPELLDARPAWGGGKMNATAILLEPLSEADTRELLENLLEVENLDPDARVKIVETAEGNPLFVEEMAAMLAEDGEGGDVEVPPTIHALLAARLDRLERPERDVVGRAAVEGKVFHRGSVVELSPQEFQPNVSGLLLALVRKELIRPDRPDFAGEDAFRFRHLLLRDAAYGSLPKESRAELHERFAGWLEQAAGDRIADYEEIVAYHLEQAYRYREELGPVDDPGRELARRAAGRLAAAGQRALGRTDIPAAVNLVGRAAALLPPGSSERLRLLPDLGDALQHQGALAEADSVLVEAIEGARASGDRVVELRAKLIRETFLLAKDAEPDTDQARATAEEAVSELERIGDDRALANAWIALGFVSLTLCRYDDLAEQAERAAACARRAGDRRLEATGLFWVAAAHQFGPRPVQDGIARCVAILAESEGNPAIASSARFHLGLLRAKAGEFAEGRRLVDEAQATRRELGLRLSAAAGQMVYGWLGELDGDLASAEAAMRAGAAELEEMGEKNFLSTLAAVLAENLYRQGRFDEAEHWTRLSKENSASDDLSSQIAWRSVRAKVLAERGQFTEAEKLAGEAVELGRSTDALETRAEALLALAVVLSRAGREDEAAVPAGEAVELYRTKGSTVSAAQAAAFVAELASPRPQPGRSGASRPD
jgi:class 3 adenylate cyclase/tetratricopeptide (TPR) repeat protein